MRIDTTKKISQRDLETEIAAFTDPCSFVFTDEQTVEEVLMVLQSSGDVRRPEYFYITDKENVLLGLITLTDLFYNHPSTPMHAILDMDVLKVVGDEALEKGLKLLSQHQLLVLPVVDKENHLLGILEIIPHNHENHYQSKKIHYKHVKEDIFQFIGFSIEQRKWNSPFTEYRLRMPWLLCNLVGGLICAVISQYFKLTLEAFVVLAFFIPLVLTLSESVSIQSMTLSLRFLHLRKVHWGQVGRRLLVETRSSFLLGVTSALIIAGFYFAWSIEIAPVTGIAISVISAMIISALFGALFPIILHSINLDPKVAAGPVVLMMADIFTITVYLGLNTAILMR